MRLRLDRGWGGTVLCAFRSGVWSGGGEFAVVLDNLSVPSLDVFLRLMKGFPDILDR